MFFLHLCSHGLADGLVLRWGTLSPKPCNKPAPSTVSCPAMGLKNQQRLNQQRASLGFLVHFCMRLEQSEFIWTPPHLCRRATLRQRGLPSPIYRKKPSSGENRLQSDYLILVLSIRCNYNHLVKVYCFLKAGTMQGLGSVVGEAFLEAHARIGF